MTARELTELARETPWRELDRGAVERVRENLLKAAMAGPPPAKRVYGDRRGTLAASFAAVAAAIFFAALFFSRFDPRVEAEAVPTLEPEIVRLTDGRLLVRAAEHGDRPMRVVIGDAEIDARASDFEVVAENDRIVAVFSSSGMVEVKRFGVTPMVLQPGVRWEKEKKQVHTFSEQRLEPRRSAVKKAALKKVEEPAQAAPLEQPAQPAQSAQPAKSAPPAVEETPVIAKVVPELDQFPNVVHSGEISEPKPDEHNFRHGWKRYQALDYAEAARAFGSVDPDGPWGEDASYWRAQSYIRQLRSAEAIAALRSFLAKYPASPRRGEMMVALGWLLVKAEQRLEARRLFKVAADDPSDSVRESARRGYLETEED